MRTLLLIILAASLLPGEVALGRGIQKGNIHPNVKLSLSERFRFVAWDNVVNLADTADGGSSFTRHRTSIMSQWFADPRLEFGLKLTNEFRYYLVPKSKEFTFSEVIVDQLYIKWNNAAVMPGTLTLGRQNVILGEGFVVMDGHPLDGSRSVYFNAVRFDWRLRREGQLTLFYAYQPETDNMLPLIHDCQVPLVDQPEVAVGVYFTGRLDRTALDTYFIRKDTRRTDTLPKSSVNAFGARVQRPVIRDVELTAEGAYQFGKHSHENRSAFGGYLYLTCTMGWPSYFPRSITAGTIYLSGDNPRTDRWEAWDPVFGRWPKWSESYIGTLVRENGVAYWSNLASLYGRIQFAITPELECRFDYHHLMAPQESDTSLSYAGGGGTTRGDLLIAKLSFHINSHISGHLLWEGFLPGSFYFDEADSYSWIRTEFFLRM